MHTTNYINTFIVVAEDCPTKIGEAPIQLGIEKTAALLQYEMVINNPYKYTSDEVFFNVFAVKNKIGYKTIDEERERFFSKEQPCFRASPLLKRYGWGVHNNNEGKVALYAVESEEYKKFSRDKELKQVKAMRNRRG